MNGLVRFDPFRELGSLHKQLDDMFNSFWSDNLSTLKGGMPATDVYTEDDKQLVAEVHAPGFSKDDIEVNVHDGVLEVKGHKQEKEEQKDKQRSYMMRQSSSSFSRRIVLPRHADADKVQANFENGMLKVVVPFKELPKPKKVAIQSGK